MNDTETTATTAPADEPPEPSWPRERTLQQAYDDKYGPPVGDELVVPTPWGAMKCDSPEAARQWDDRRWSTAGR